jgi:gamma-glutamyl-gamma-aminobutyrate hydrolase PuuD
MAALIGISAGFTDYGDYLGVAFGRPLERLGAVSVALPYAEHPEALLPFLDGLVLAVGRDIDPARYGGCAHPKITAHSALRDEFELELTRRAIDAGVPVLGICRGMQVIDVALGGTLHADHTALAGRSREHPGGDWSRWEQVVEARLHDREPPAHPGHEIEIVAGSALAAALGARAWVNSYHHQSIDRLGAGVTVCAHAPDGVIEAIEVASAPALCLGVQWELQEQPDSPVFSLLVSAAERRAAERAGVLAD